MTALHQAGERSDDVIGTAPSPTPGATGLAIHMSERYGHIGQKALRDAMDVLGTRENGVECVKNPPKWGRTSPEWDFRN